MSAELIAAHRALDGAVDRLFKKRGSFKNEAERLTFLFERYSAFGEGGLFA